LSKRGLKGKKQLRERQPNLEEQRGERIEKLARVKKMLMRDKNRLSCSHQHEQAQKFNR
jgi:hypothetical protein